MRVGWKVPLAALCTAALVSFSSSGVTDAAPSPWLQENHPILDVLGRPLYHKKRAIIDIYDTCPLDSNSLAGAMFLHFTAIFFEDFTTGGGTDILGPLAVGGQFTAPNYIVNANRGQDCSVDPQTGLEGIGLVVGGETLTTDTRVHGDSVHAGGGDLSQIVELDGFEGCAIFDNIGTGVFDFDVAENAAIQASLILALTEPNMYMDGEGRITDLGSSGSNYKVFTFNTCNGGDCNVGGILSNPDAIFLGIGNFNGPTGDVPSFDDTVVFNIPVTEGDTIELRTNFPSQGFYACRTIYNFYPVNSQGIFSSGGEITVFRNTGGQIEGFTLAPRAHIRDGTTGAFAGTIIGLDYAWYYGSIGVELHDYGAADDNCNDFEGCFPISTTETPQYTTITLTRTTTAPGTTVTTFGTQTITTTATHISTTTAPVTRPSRTFPVTTITHPGTTYTTHITTTETETETETFVTEYTTHIPTTITYTLPETTTYSFTTVTTEGPTTETETITTVETTSSIETITTTVTGPDGSMTVSTLTTYVPVTTTETYLTTETISGTTETLVVVTTETTFSVSESTITPTDDQTIITTMYTVDTDVTTEETDIVITEPGSVETSYSFTGQETGLTTLTLTETTVMTLSTAATYTTVLVTGSETTYVTVSELPGEPTTRTRTTGALTTISDYPITTTTTTVYASTVTGQPMTTLIYAYPEDEGKDKWDDKKKGEWGGDKKDKEWDEGKKKGKGEKKGKKKEDDWEDDEDCDDEE